MENENRENIKIRSIFDTNLMYSLKNYGKKLTKKNAKEYLLNNVGEVIFTLNDFNQFNIPTQYGHKFALDLNQYSAERGFLLTFIEWIRCKGSHEEIVSKQFQFLREDCEFKNIKIISIKDVYEETIDIDDQYAYETWIKFECTIVFKCKEFKI